MRNCESHVSSAIWHGEVGCTGKKSMRTWGKTGSWTVCRFRAEKVDEGRERERERGREGDVETDHNMRKIT